MTTAMPTNKVAYGAVAGAVVGILAWVVKTWGHQEMPVEIGMSLTTVITFVVQYFVPDATPPETPK